MRLSYFIEKALASLRDAPGISLLTAATIGTALLVLGAYVASLQNLEGLALVWGRNATVSVYLSEQLPKTDWDAARQSLAEIDGVRRAILVTPVEALSRVRARGPEAAALVEGVTEEILPPTVEITLAPGFANLEEVARVAQLLQSADGVGEVDYGREEFERLQALLDLLRFGGMLAGLFIGLATAFIISNTIKLTVYARRDEIAILRLVGATDGFIRLPFLFEGALWGLGGGILGATMLWALDISLAPRISEAVANVLGGLEIHLFTIDIGLALLAAGTVLGVVGSALAVRRFLDVETT